MIEALILGIVQGVTEFFPVSSTAHLILLPWFFTWGGDLNTLTFDVALHSMHIIAGATLLHAQKMAAETARYDLDLFMIGFAASALTGLAAIKFLMSFFRKYSLNAFVYYRFLLATVIISGIWLKI